MQRRPILWLVSSSLLAASLSCLSPSPGASPGPAGGAAGTGAPATMRPPSAGAGGSSAPTGSGGSGGSAGAAGSGGGSAGSAGGSAGAVGGSGGSIGGSGGGAVAPPPAPADAGGSPDGAPADAIVVGPPPPAPREFRKPGLVVYWGQNSYSNRATSPMQYETDLFTTCQNNPHYEMVVLAFVNRFIVPVDMTSTPMVNFSRHCNNKYAFAQCDQIGRGINECQRRGIKVILSLGGASGAYGFTSDENARQFAQSTWDIFLNGQSTYRPFRTAVLDGVDLDIEGGSTTGYTAYVRRLRELMNTDRSRRYYITAAPQCPFPDAHLGPAPGRPLGDAANLFDLLFVQFYNNFCGGFNPDLFVQAFNQWSQVGPPVVVGLPAGVGAGNTFVDRGQLPGLLGRVKNNPAFGGVMLWDASFDQNSAAGGQSFSAFVKAQLP
jgi:chitinase